MEDPVLQPGNTFTIDPTDIIVSPIPQKSSYIGTVAAPIQISCKPSPRSYDEAVLYACQQQHVCDEEKIKTLCLVDSLSLQPIAITDQQGTEHIALTHAQVVNKLVNTHESIKPILTSKRSYSDMIDKGALCVQCRTEATDGLENLLLMSPYTTLLSQQNFVEISDQVCHFLNSDWEFFPQFRFFSAMALAGAILVNVSNNQAVILNTIEVYGRTKPVDVFCEPFGKIKGSAQPTSIPPTAIRTRYPGLWPTTLASSEGLKLVIGTNVSNILVTSSMRLDKIENPSIGGITTNFTIPSTKDSLYCKLFMDRSMLDQAMTIVNNPGIHRLSDTLILGQLRAIRSKFHTTDAYILCRATGPLTMSHLHQPCSLFTLSEFKSIPASAIFRIIATSVLKNGQAAGLSKKRVQDTLALCSGSSAKTALTDILDLFGPEGDDIPILGNANLNRKLEELANGIKSHLVVANEVTAKYIVNTFNTFA